jgi:TPR repeat protein
VLVLREGERLTLSLPIKDALATFQEDCKHGEAAGCTALSQILLKTDPERAMSLAEQGCLGDDASGCVAQGTFLLLLQRTPDRTTRALALFERSCKRGNQVGCTMLGEMLLTGGEGLVLDQPRGARLFEEACEVGELLACADLSGALWYGVGVSRDSARAIGVAETACEGGIAHACGNLASFLLERRDHQYSASRVASLAKQSCDGGAPNGCLVLARLYLLGEGIERDPEKALAMARTACDQGLEVGCALVPSLEEAMEHFKRGRRFGHEADAIGQLRTLISAQGAYQEVNHGWYDAKIGCLQQPGACLSGYPSDGAKLLPADFEPDDRKGYSFKLIAGPPPEETLAPGASRSSVTCYAYVAIPSGTEVVGARSFCGDSSGIICARPDGHEITPGQDCSCVAAPGCPILQ